ncbi:MAG: protein kinase [Myxacorys chilensis ATA2-1-KO14]|jgi:serine/threonine-protein kinase|nr:protein kinase [Myxacorys chilensis ATA2-1-KO14]
MQHWSNSRKWDENWTTERELDSGGQATAKLVKNNSTGQRCFLKMLSRQGDMERRARFFREATAYATTNHKLIPKLIESNALHHQDSEYKLYLVTDYIEGQNLTEYIGTHGYMEFKDASTVLLQLIDAVEYCHSNEWIHRDIKPDNIVLRKSSALMPVLLDFGISYKEGIIGGFETDYSQELGNRFLRLPEMSAYSTAKQDKRSDISFLGGILYYLITSVSPSVLIDEEGRMPHQRMATVERLKCAFDGRFSALSDFFDKSFSQKLSDRFTSTHEMKESLKRLIDMHDNSDPNEGSISINDIVSSLNSKVDQELLRNRRLYELAMQEIRDVHSEILERIQPTYTSYQTGHVNFVDGLRNDLGFAHFSTHDHRFVPSFLIKIVGNELVVMVDGTSIYRTEVESPHFSEEFLKTLEDIYLNGLKSLVDKPLS